jgi:hypothetical protein
MLRVMRYGLALLIVAALPSIGLTQSPANGSWSFVMNSPMGSVTAKVELQSDGEGLTGSFDLGTGTTWPIENGSVKDNQSPSRSTVPAPR